MVGQLTRQVVVCRVEVRQFGVYERTLGLQTHVRSHIEDFLNLRHQLLYAALDLILSRLLVIN